MTTIINFFGGPGIGKSTTAANAYSYLQAKGYSCELVREFARELVWANRIEDLKDQLYVFAEQNHRQIQLMDKVDYIITDSPIILGLVYRKVHNHPMLQDTLFDDFIISLYNKYNNINFFIKREIVENFEVDGRLQDQSGAIEIDNLLINILNEHSVQYNEIDRNDFYKMLDLAINGQLNLL